MITISIATHSRRKFAGSCCQQCEMSDYSDDEHTCAEDEHECVDYNWDDGDELHDEQDYDLEKSEEFQDYDSDSDTDEDADVVFKEMDHGDSSFNTHSGASSVMLGVMSLETVYRNNSGLID